MIIEGLLNLIMSLLEFIFSPISLPGLPDQMQSVIDAATSYLVSGVGILGLFFDWNTVVILIPLVIIIANFKRLWDGIMFILRKIPFIGIE